MMSERARIRSAAAARFQPANHTEKAQGTVNAYTDWVLNNLVGPFGRDRADVVQRILNDWIWQNRDYLDQIGIPLPEVTPRRLVITDESD